MKVVLLDNVKGIGQVGDVKEVHDGFARNFLIPRSLGKLATERAIREADALKAVRLVSADLEHNRMLEVAQKISGMTIEIQGKANDKGTLFSGITAEEIATKVSEAAGVHLPASAIVTHEHLKKTGIHSVDLKLADSVVATVSVDVRPL